MLLHRFIVGAPGGRQNVAADGDAQPFTNLDQAALDHTHPELDQPSDLLAQPGHAQPDALGYSYLFQHLDAAAHPDPHGDLHALANPFRHPFADAEQHPAALADL